MERDFDCGLWIEIGGCGYVAHHDESFLPAVDFEDGVIFVDCHEVFSHIVAVEEGAIVGNEGYMVRFFYFVDGESVGQVGVVDKCVGKAVGGLDKFAVLHVGSDDAVLDEEQVEAEHLIFIPPLILPAISAVGTAHALPVVVYAVGERYAGVG